MVQIREKYGKFLDRRMSTIEYARIEVPCKYERFRDIFDGKIRSFIENGKYVGGK